MWLWFGAGRFSLNYTYSLFSEKMLFILAATITTIGFFLVSLSTNCPTVPLGFVIIGLGLSSDMPTILSKTSQTAPVEQHSTAIGTVSTIAYSGRIISPILIGSIATVISLKLSWIV